MKAGHSNRIYFLTDAQSTVRDIVNGAGEVVQSYEFDPHGIPLPGSGAGSVASAKTYHGGLSVNDDMADTGLYLMGHRFWAPELGRFISRDPIGFRGGLNLYGAAFGNNPVTFADPSGLKIRLSGPSMADMKLFASYLGNATGSKLSVSDSGYLSVVRGGDGTSHSNTILAAISDPTSVVGIRVVSGAGDVHFGMARGQDRRGPTAPYDNIHKVDIADFKSLMGVHQTIGMGKIVHEATEAIFMNPCHIDDAPGQYQENHRRAIDEGENSYYSTHGMKWLRSWDRFYRGQLEEYFGPATDLGRGGAVNMTLSYPLDPVITPTLDIP